jgi:TPR repeat protein
LAQAAQAGHTHAQFEVAVCYKKAIGVGRDEPASLLWLNKAIADPAVRLG